MNREIKFRFWGNFGELNEEEDICEMEMLYGNRFCFFESEPINNLFDCRNFQVMQYTGLKDKNGKEIYEGDIVKYKNYNGFSVIRYKKGSFFFYGVSLIHFLFNVKEKEVEIIGNIFENPELTQSSE